MLGDRAAQRRPASWRPRDHHAADGFATTLAILRAGAEPAWCDVDETGGLDLDRVERSLAADRSIRAILPVHLYGHPLDPVRLQRARRGARSRPDRGLRTVGRRETRRHARRDGRRGGRDEPLSDQEPRCDGRRRRAFDKRRGDLPSARRLRDYGQRLRYEHVEIGLNSRLDELHAAILRSAMLPRLDALAARRREIAGRYTEALGGTSLRPILPGAGDRHTICSLSKPPTGLPQRSSGARSRRHRGRAPLPDSSARISPLRKGSASHWTPSRRPGARRARAFPADPSALRQTMSWSG